MDLYILKDLSKLRPRLIVLFVLLLMFIIDFPTVDIPNIPIVKDAEARIGRPASPGSVAGVHRRTRRRTRRRVARTTRVYALPAGCIKIIRTGVVYYQCAGVYYKPYYEGNTTVYEVVDAP